jgi:putative glutamine amidotransferase
MTASPPLIAVSSRSRAAGEVQNFSTNSAVVQCTYLEALWRAGAVEAVVAPREITLDVAAAIVARVDGLLLVGGGDVDPARYGSKPHERLYGVNAHSDSLELALVDAAWRARLPVLAICRGAQVVNVARGGTLHQHITDRAGWIDHGRPGQGGSEHDVTVVSGSLLHATQPGRGTGDLVIERCSCTHHQAIDVLGDGLVATAHAADGCVEAVERADGLAWLVAPQWHPERTADTNPAQQLLFDAFVAAADVYRSASNATPRGAP